MEDRYCTEDRVYKLKLVNPIYSYYSFNYRRFGSSNSESADNSA